MRRWGAAAVVFGAALIGGVAWAQAPMPQPAPVEPRHALAMHGEPKYGPGFDHFDYVNPQAPKGGAVVLAAIGDTFNSLNPYILKGDAAAGLGLMYDTLLTSSADEAFTEYGLAAQSVEVPPDRSWIVFTLRPEARFHDGTPMTAEDVAFTFETLQTKGQPFYRYYYGSVDKVEVLGARRVRFSFVPGENRELPLILGQMPVLPKHYWEGRDFEQSSLDLPLGSGPYRIKRFEPGRFIEYQRVPDYWGRDLGVNKGQYNFDTIRYDYYRDSTVAIEALKAGEYDFRYENSSKAWAVSYDTPAIDDGRLVKRKFPNQNGSGMQSWAFNLRRPLFQDPEVREALAYAFDFEWSNKALFYGQYERTESYFSNSELASSGLPDAEELAILEPYRGRIPEQVFTEEYHPPRTKGDGSVRGNLCTALKMLEEAGWDMRGHSLVNRVTGEPFAFEILLVSPLMERIALPFAANLRKLGIEATVRTVDTAQYRNRLQTYDFDMIVGGWGQSLSPGNEQREFWGSEAADRPGGRNYVGIKDPVIDDLIEKLIAAPDREALIARTRALDRVLLWNHFVIPQFGIGYDRVAYWDRFGIPEVTPMQGYQFLAWWIDPARDAALKAKGGR